AKSAGMRDVAIPNAAYPPDDATLELADAVVRSLDHLTIEVLPGCNAALDDAVAAGVVGADVRRRRGIEVLAEHGEDRHVAERLTPPRRPGGGGGGPRR